jgi:aspartate-semialdehyde dehydrogenase
VVVVSVAVAVAVAAMAVSAAPTAVAVAVAVVAVKAAVAVVSAAAVVVAAAVTDLLLRLVNAGEIKSPQALPRGFFIASAACAACSVHPSGGRLAFSERGW